jgi:pyruvate dehydrogenase E1 component alpha subunit
VGDINREYYRSKEEETFWKENRDPITNFGKWLSGEGLASKAELEKIRDEVKADAEAAVAYALQARYPGPSEVGMHVYASNTA